MQTFVMMFAGLACLAMAVLVLYKLAPRDGDTVAAWMQATGVEITVAVIIVMMLAFGVALLVSSAAS